ncbi:hypothetical protein HDZ31DRAFT_68047 [Schizophyllum fasciatum]
MAISAGMGTSLDTDTDTEPETEEDDSDPASILEPMDVTIIFKPASVHVPQATRQRWHADSHAKRILDMLASISKEYGGGLPACDLPILLCCRPDLVSARHYRQILFNSEEAMARYEIMRQEEGLVHLHGNAFQQEYSEMVVAASSLLAELRNAITAGNTGLSADLCAMKVILRAIRGVEHSISEIVEAEEDACKGIKYKLRTSGGVAFEGVPY